VAHFAVTEFRPSCVLVTGGAGFIGSNFIRWLLAHDADVRVVNFDALTYAGNLESLADVKARHGATGDGRYFFLHADVRDFGATERALTGQAREADADGGRTVPPCDAVMHFAAESHVDRSILGPVAFVETNVRGTATLLEACRGAWGRTPRGARFLPVGTDEVYGSLDPEDPAFTETTPLAPNSPYSASKAAADLLVRAWGHTFDFPAIITRCSNNYGPYQFPEKLIPLMITRALADQPLPVYGDGQQARDWLHVADHAAALWEVLRRGRCGEVYNIGGRAEWKNLDVVRLVLHALGKPDRLIQFVTDRPGHDRRYAMDASKLERELAWAPRERLEHGIPETVRWYVAHRSWWERVLNEAYRAASALYL
jgi:dTDP-glucose 4,6-dehydratase